MLCILKRTAPLDGSFEYPQQFFSLVERDKKMFNSCADPEGDRGSGPSPPPGKLQKYRVPLNELLLQNIYTGPRSAVGNVSGYRCVSDCRARGREFDPGPVPYFRGD